VYIRSVSGRGERPQQLGQLLRFVHCSATQHIFHTSFGPVRIRAVFGCGKRPQQLGQLLRFVRLSATQHIFPTNFGPVRISGQCPAVAKDHSSWVSSCVSFSIQQYNTFSPLTLALCVSGQCLAVAKDHSSWVSSCVSFGFQQHNTFSPLTLALCVYQGSVRPWRKTTAAGSAPAFRSAFSNTTHFPH